MSEKFEKFLGVWKADLSSYDTNFDQVMEAMKMNPKAVMAFKEKAGTLKYALDGDNWTAEASIEGFGTRVFKYKLGEQIDGVGLDGVAIKTTSRYEGDALIENSISQTTGIAITITRRAEGDVLLCTLRVDEANVETNYKMTRI